VQMVHSSARRKNKIQNFARAGEEVIEEIEN
jgi:hypothetical protein